MDHESLLPPQTRRDLAQNLAVPYKRLTYVLYHLGRESLYREFSIGKANGDVRTLHAVRQPLRGLQRVALNYLQQRWKPTAYAHGFTPERSIVTNAGVHRRAKLILKVDIEDFFPSISFPRVEGMFRAPPFNFGPEAAVTLAQLACLDGDDNHLPQGGVLSPYVANMLCRKLDVRLARLANEHSCRYTRYADDMTFSSNDISRLQTGTFLDAVNEIIKSESFAPNTKKTKILTKRDRQIVTGIVVNEGINVPRKYMRNIRATLYNCEQHGIESQVVRQQNFKDDRNSRNGLLQVNGQFFIGDREVARDDACEIFLRHLFGKISFVASVVMSMDQGARPEQFRRVLAYERLLERFYKLVERDSRFRGVKRIAVRRIAKHPRVQARLDYRQQRDVIRTKALSAYQSDAAVQSRLRMVDSAADRSALEQIVEELVPEDPRFFQFEIPADLARAKKNVRRLLKFPAIDSDSTQRVLHSLKNSHDGLGFLTHHVSVTSGGDRFTPDRALKILNEIYDPGYFQLPKHLKQLLDPYVDALDAVLMEGVDVYEPLDIDEHPRLASAMQALKVGSRFQRVPSPNDASSLRKVIDAACRYGHQKAGRKDIVTNVVPFRGLSLYTVVPAVESAMNDLMHSMAKNTMGRQINVIVEDFPNEQVLEIAVVDDSDGDFGDMPNRGFAHGKIATAVRLTNGLCAYWIEAAFAKSGRVCIDMHTGQYSSSTVRFDHGFAHRLRFHS